MSFSDKQGLELSFILFKKCLKDTLRKNWRVNKKKEDTKSRKYKIQNTREMKIFSDILVSEGKFHRQELCHKQRE